MRFDLDSLDTRIRLAASAYVGWRYCKMSESPRVAFIHPAMPLATPRNHTEQRVNCSSLTASILMEVYPRAAWGERDYGDMQVFADRLPGMPDAPIRAIDRLEIGEPVSRRDVDRAIDEWYLVQGWRSLRTQAPSGHAFLLHVMPAVATVLESSSLNRGDGASIGPRWRRVSLTMLDAEFPAGLHFGRLIADPRFFRVTP